MLQGEAHQSNTSYRLDWKYSSAIHKVRSIALWLIQWEFNLWHQWGLVIESSVLRSRDPIRFLCCRALWSPLLTSSSSNFLVTKATMLYVWFEVKKRKCSAHKRELPFKSPFLPKSLQWKAQPYVWISAWDVTKYVHFMICLTPLSNIYNPLASKLGYIWLILSTHNCFLCSYSTSESSKWIALLKGEM